MASEEKSNPSRVDGWIERVERYITGTISSFVAFLFFLFALGAMYGAVVISKSDELGIYLIIALALIGLIAYYSRTFSLIIFTGVIVFIIL